MSERFAHRYQLLGANSQQALADAVNTAIVEGWQPYGSPVVQGIAPIQYYQAMILTIPWVRG